MPKNEIYLKFSSKFAKKKITTKKENIHSVVAAI